MTARGEFVKREDTVLLFLPIFRTRLFSTATSVDTWNEVQHRLVISAEIARDFQGNAPFHLYRLLRAVHRKTLDRHRGKFRVKYPEDQSFRELFFLGNAHHGLSQVSVPFAVGRNFRGSSFPAMPVVSVRRVPPFDPKAMRLDGC